MKRKTDSPRDGIHSARRPIAVVGYDDSTRELLKAALLLGFEPIAVFAPNLASQGSSEIVVEARELRAMAGLSESPAETSAIAVVDHTVFRRIAAENNALTVIGVCAHRERDFFRENLLHARNHLKIEGPLLHPAFFAITIKSRTGGLPSSVFPVRET